MRCILFVALLALAPAVWCETAGEDAIEVVQRCSDSASEDVYGLTNLESECPGLTQALEDLGYLPLLSDPMRDVLQVYDLSDLLQVADWYQQRAAQDVRVDTLAPILDSLRAQEPQRPPTLFERFKRWLRSLLERRQQDSGNWLSQWLEDVDIPTAVTRTLLLGAMILAVALAIAVIYNELRAAGVLRKRPVVQDPVVQATAGAAPAASEADLDAATAERKAPMLLRMLVATLVKSGRLRTERSLTYRELCTRANFDDNEQRECFRRVAVLAERTVYGSAEVSAEELEPVVAAARALDARLRGTPA